MTPPAAPAAPAPTAERHAPEPNPAPGPVAARTSEPRVGAPEAEPVADTPATPDKPAGTPAGEIALAALDAGNWHQLLSGLGLTGIVQNIASHCELRSNDSGHLQFVLDEGNSTLFNDSHADKLRLALENYFNEPLKVAVETGPVNAETPAMRASRLAGERQQQAVEAIENDPNLQALMARFDGELDRSTIVPTDA